MDFFKTSNVAAQRQRPAFLTDTNPHDIIVVDVDTVRRARRRRSLGIATAARSRHIKNANARTVR